MHIKNLQLTFSITFYTMGARGLHAPHPDGRPKAVRTSGQHEANEVSEDQQPSAGRLDGECLDLWHPG